MAAIENGSSSPVKGKRYTIIEPKIALPTGQRIDPRRISDAVTQVRHWKMATAKEDYFMSHFNYIFIFILFMSI